MAFGMRPSCSLHRQREAGVAEDLHRDARMHVEVGEQRAAAAAAVVDGDGADRMITRALDAGVSARWVAGDEVYGADPALRAELEARRVGYVLAIGCDRRVPTAAGRCVPTSSPPDSRRRAWQRLSAGGARGSATTTGRWITHPDPAADTLTQQTPRQPVLVAARSASPRTPVSWGSTAATHPDSSSRCASWSASPDSRWTVEESFQAGRGLAGLAITPSFALLL